MGVVKRTVKRLEERKEKETIEHTEIEEIEEIIDVPVCDFCEQEYPEEDAETFLTPVVLNPQIKQQNSLSDIVEIPKDDSFNRQRELYRALNKTQFVDYKRKQIMEPQVEWHNADEKLKSFEGGFNDSILDDVIAYEFVLNIPQPKIRDEGSIEVCKFCKEQFK